MSPESTVLSPQPDAQFARLVELLVRALGTGDRRLRTVDRGLRTE